MKSITPCMLALGLSAIVSAQTPRVELTTSLDGGAFSSSNKTVSTEQFLTVRLSTPISSLNGQLIALAGDLVPCGFTLCVDLDLDPNTCDFALGSGIFFIVNPNTSNPFAPTMSPFGFQISIQLPDTQALFVGPDDEMIRLQGAIADPSMPFGISVSTHVDHHVSTIALNGPALDDNGRLVQVGGGFPFYGTVENVLWVNTNGSLTFGAQDPDPSPSAAEFLSGAPRIAGMWSDLNPAAGGTLRTYYNRACGGAYTSIEARYTGIPAKGLPGTSNSFSLTLFPNGDIHMSWTGVDPLTTVDSIAGLSPGFSLSPMLPEIDLSQAFGSVIPSGQAFYELGGHTGHLDTLTDLAGVQMTFQYDGMGGYTVLGTPPAPVPSSASPSTGSAAGGTTVTLSGLHFQSGTPYQVAFGASIVTATYVDPCTLTCVAPAGIAGPVTLTLREAGVPVANVPGFYTYL